MDAGSGQRCFLRPDLPGCAEALGAPPWHACPGLTAECSLALTGPGSVFRNRTGELLVALADFVAANGACYNRSFAPCWEGSASPVQGFGRLAQGSCLLDCENNVSQYEKHCRQAAGHLCGADLALGLSGTELTTKLPVCLPSACYKSSGDLSALSACLTNHTCSAVSADVRRLFPECKASLGCAPSPLDEGPAAVTALFSTAGALVVLVLFRIFVCRFRQCRKPGEKSGKDAAADHGGGGDRELQRAPSDYRILQRPASAARESHALDTYPLSVGERKSSRTDHAVRPPNRDCTPNPHPPRFLLSESLRQLQGTGRYVLGSRGMESEGFIRGSALSFRNLFFRYKGRRLIQGVSGLITRGSCTAVIGSPDSGATTLLQCIAGRQPRGKLSGSLLIDGVPPDAHTRRIVAYIPKEDINHPVLSVRETLAFSSACRLPRNVPQSVKNQRVRSWLQLLGLKHVAETVVGNAELRGISGGERRRVSLGAELIAGHRIIIADSPTNGLDSTAAFNVVKTMRALADAGHCAFVATVRQPSPELLDLFDTVCLMSRGQCIYWGPLSAARDFLADLGFPQPANKAFPDFLEELTGDPARFLRSPPPASYEGVDRIQSDRSVAGGRTAGDGRQSPLRSSKNEMCRQDLRRGFVESKYFEMLGKRMWNAIDAGATEITEMDAHSTQGCSAESLYSNGGKNCPRQLIDADGKFVCHSSAYPTGFFWQIFHCTIRQTHIVARSPTVRARIARSIFLGVLLGTMFPNLAHNQEAANNRFGLLFISLSAITMGSVATIPELFAQRRIFYHQKRAGYFRPVAWHFSVVVVEIPIVAVEMLIYSALLYGLCSLNGGIMSMAFLYFYFTMVSVNLICWSVAATAVMVFPEVIAATAIVPVYNALNLLFSGYLISRRQTPGWLQWLHSLSTISRPFHGVAINEFHGELFRCEDTELIPFRDDPLLDVPAPQGYNSAEYRTCPIDTGANALQFLFDLDQTTNKWLLLATNLVYLAVFQFLLALAIYGVDYSMEISDDPAATLAEDVSSSGTSALQRIPEGTTPPASDAAQDNDLREPLLKHEAGVRFDGENKIEGTRDDIDQDSFLGSVEFTNVNYSVSQPDGKTCCGSQPQRQLLFSVSGYALPGRVVALMGPSGAGKTTLLDVIAKRKTGGKISGEFLANGYPMDATLSRYSGYVEQVDSHLPTLTVREAIFTSAALRLPPTVSSEEKHKRTNRIIDQLLLTKYAGCLIGTPGVSGIAPEVRKLVTIAVELVCDPMILFLDEPTTGLDSASALATMQLVRNVCRQKAVLCTIHQPAKEIFSIFDDLLLLQKGGRVAYFGPVKMMERFFASIGLAPRATEANPADYALECASATLSQPFSTPADAYAASAFARETLEAAPSYQRRSGTNANRKPLPPPLYTDAFANSSWSQFLTLLGVYYRFHRRDYPVLRARFLLPVVFALIIGALFYDLQVDQLGAKARVSVVFISLIFAGNSANMAIPASVMTRPVVFRERHSNAYRLCPLFWATLIAEFPFVVVQGLLYSSTFYFLVGFQQDLVHFVAFAFAFVLLMMQTFSFSHLIASISPNADIGVILSAIVQSVFTLFCGFMLPFSSIPVYWRWAYYTSMFRYPLGYFVSNELRGRNFFCPVGDSVIGPGLPVGAFPVFVGGNSSFPPPPWGNGILKKHCVPVFGNFTNLASDCWRFFCPIEAGEFILDTYHLPKTLDGEIMQLVIMVLFFVALRILGFFSLWCIQHIRR